MATNGLGISSREPGEYIIAANFSQRHLLFQCLSWVACRSVLTASNPSRDIFHLTKFFANLALQFWPKLLKVKFFLYTSCPTVIVHFVTSDRTQLRFFRMPCVNSSGFLLSLFYNAIPENIPDLASEFRWTTLAAGQRIRNLIYGGVRAYTVGNFKIKA